MVVGSIFLKAWDLEGFLRYCADEKEHPCLRMILASDGMITRNLQVLHLKPLELELISQSTGPMSPEAMQHLELKDHQQAIYRKIWLRLDDQRILYASSILAFPSAGRTVISKVLSNKKPLGQSIEDRRILSLKDKYTIGRVVSPKIAGGFGLQPATELWARHYRLTIDRGIRASILEVFSPSAFIE